MTGEVAWERLACSGTHGGHGAPITPPPPPHLGHAAKNLRGRAGLHVLQRSREQAAGPCSRASALREAFPRRLCCCGVRCAYPNGAGAFSTTTLKRENERAAPRGGRPARSGHGSSQHQPRPQTAAAAADVQGLQDPRDRVPVRMPPRLIVHTKNGRVLRDLAAPGCSRCTRARSPLRAWCRWPMRLDTAAASAAPAWEPLAAAAERRMRSATTPSTPPPGCCAAALTASLNSDSARGGLVSVRRRPPAVRRAAAGEALGGGAKGQEAGGGGKVRLSLSPAVSVRPAAFRPTTSLGRLSRLHTPAEQGDART